MMNSLGVKSSDVVNLNVGGRRFCTSKNTLLWHKNSFFTILLSGHLPSCKDETGAFFIDRDPDLFAVILNYMRTNELNLMGVDASTLRNEAQFYGLDSLVKKLSFCEENFSGNCGDLLFHAYMPSPGFSTEGNEQSKSSKQSTAAVEQRDPRVATPDNHGDANTDQCSTKPVTLIACHQNLMAAVYRDQVGLFYLRDPIGWHLVWLSPPLSAPIDRLAITSKATHPVSLPTTTMNSMTNSTGPSVSPPTMIPGTPLIGPSTMQVGTTNPGVSTVTTTTTVAASTTNPLSSSVPGPSSGTNPPVSNSPTVTSGPGVAQAASSGVGSSIQAPLILTNSGCMVAAAVGSTITLWCIYSPVSNTALATHVASCGGAFGVSTTSTTLYLSPLTPFSPSARPGQPGHYAALPRAKEPWSSEVIGRYDLNGRAVDYLLFIGAHLVALSRRGLVGVRHIMTNTWQVWSTVPILSYAVAASELLLLGCANGRICSINIQKFPLRIVDNDLLVTEMYRDPQQDPITALSVLLTIKPSFSTRNCMDIAYGTLSGRVCLIVQYPENVGCSPQLLQTFTVHRSMVTRVVLSERHLISVCIDFNHVRTWAVTRFRGVISTQPGSTPIASFHITALDTTNPQQLVDCVLEAAQRCAAVSKPSAPRDVVTRAHSNVLPAHIALRDQLQRQPQSHPQSFRLSSVWRRHGSHSRSPGGGGAAGSAEFDNAAVLPQSHPGRSHSPDSGDATCVQFEQTGVRPLDSLHNDVVVLPRTSWLHEDPGNPSARTSLVTNGARTVDGGDHGGPVVPSERSDCGTGTNTHAVGRCQTFHGTSTTAGTLGPHSSSNLSSSFCPGAPAASSAPSGTTCRPTPCIDVHRYANDPGPYGEREDVLIFVQKLTPHAHQLFVRLASNGKRVCVIRSVDGVPITSFSVHEHDGSNRVGAHPRRYLFTGHADGAIQVWDLTTALSILKQGSTLTNGGTGLEGYVNHTEYASAGPVGVVGVPGTVGPSGSGGLVGMTGMASGAPGNFLCLNAGCVPSWLGSGGPSSRELIRLLESCQLGNSSCGSSMIGLPSGPVTPADSLHSLCIEAPGET